jgi:hypothetical protein
MCKLICDVTVVLAGRAVQTSADNRLTRG